MNKAKWEQYSGVSDFYGETVLLRECAPGKSATPGYYVGIGSDDELHGPCLLTAAGRVPIHWDKYEYHYLRIRDIVF